MITCAFIVCCLQAAICGNHLRKARLPTAEWLGNLTGAALGALGAIGTWPLVVA